MKKILSIALVALLAASAVFAGITGKASFAAGYDLDKNLFSLSNPKTSDSTFSVEFDASTGETAAVESGVYAEFKGSVTANMTEDGLSVKTDLKDALIKSTDGLWSVNLTKVANGVEVTYAGFAADVYYKDKLHWGASFSTPEYAIIEGLTVSANVGYDEVNDLTDPANWSKKVWKEGVEDAIDEARKKAYSATYDDGTYKIKALSDLQDAITKAENDLKAAKDAFAKKQTKDNYSAIEAKTKALAKAEKALNDAIADLEYQFMANNSGADKWYKASTEYVTSTKWIAGDTKIVTGEDTENKVYNEVDPSNNLKLTNAVKGETYYLTSNVGDGTFVLASEYVLADGVIIFAFDAPNKGTVYVQKVTQTKEVVTYDANPDKCYDFAPTNGEETKTVKGGLTLAYAKDLFAASVAGNVKYERLAKAVGFDVTANASYDFVKGGVSFERTLKGKNLLGANVEATYAGVTVKASASDILAQGEDGTLVSAEVGGSVAGVTAKVSGEYKFGNDFHKTGVGSFTMAGEVGYAFDFVAISAKLAGGTEYKKVEHDYKTAKVYVAPELTLTNKTLVQNAELSLAWTGAKLFGTDPKKGAVTAKVSVAF